MLSKSADARAWDKQKSIGSFKIIPSQILIHLIVVQGVILASDKVKNFLVWGIDQQKGQPWCCTETSLRKQMIQAGDANRQPWA
jgi:hypothetical protein